MSTLEVKAIQAPTGYDLQMPAGHILQVVQGSYASSTSSSSSTYADTGLTANITPSLTSSKILVIVNHPEVARIGSGTPDQIKLAIKLMRDSTDLTVMCNQTMDYVMGYQNSNGSGWIAMAGPSVTYLDSPSSTSALTYKTQLRNATGNTNGVRIMGDAPSKITLMEVAG